MIVNPWLGTIILLSLGTRDHVDVIDGAAGNHILDKSITQSKEEDLQDASVDNEKQSSLTTGRSDCSDQDHKLQ